MKTTSTQRRWVGDEFLAPGAVMPGEATAEELAELAGWGRDADTQSHLSDPAAAAWQAPEPSEAMGADLDWQLVAEVEEALAASGAASGSAPDLGSGSGTGAASAAASDTGAGTGSDTGSGTGAASGAASESGLWVDPLQELVAGLEAAGRGLDRVAGVDAADLVRVFDADLAQGLEVVGRLRVQLTGIAVGLAAQAHARGLHCVVGMSLPNWLRVRCEWLSVPEATQVQDVRIHHHLARLTTTPHSPAHGRAITT